MRVQQQPTVHRLKKAMVSDAENTSEPESAFDFDPRTRVVHGAGTLSQLDRIVRECGGSRILLVTDQGLAEAGHPQRAEAMLVDAGLHCTVFDAVNPNPTTEDVTRCMEVAKRANIDAIVGLGGGSSMDCAKGCNFILTNGGRMEDYHGVGKATKPMLPMVAIPTTAGTGSEAQSFALISTADTHVKMACGDRKAACRVAILDPELVRSVPNSVAGATGIDAVSHAVESYVTKKRNPVSSMFSRQAWRLLSSSFFDIMQSRDNTAACGAMLLGAHFAGAAIENSMLGATHALANPLTANYGITHGVAIGIMLPHVVRFNANTVAARYGDLAADAGLCAADDPAAIDLLASHLSRMVEAAGMPASLSAVDVDRNRIAGLAEEASEQWTGTFNPTPVDIDSLAELYSCAF